MAKWIKAATKNQDKKKGSFRNSASRMKDESEAKPAKKKKNFVEAMNEPEGY